MAGILAALLIVGAAIVLATFLVPALLGGLVWIVGLGTGGDGGLRLRRRGAHIAWWPWRKLSRVIYGR